MSSSCYIIYKAKQLSIQLNTTVPQLKLNLTRRRQNTCTVGVFSGRRLLPHAHQAVVLLVAVVRVAMSMSYLGAE